jgi:hypothetical protein
VRVCDCGNREDEEKSDEENGEAPATEEGSVASKSAATGAASQESEEEEEQEEEEEEDGGMEDPCLLRIQERSERLQDRANNVEDAIKMISNLHMAFKHGESEGFSVTDLEQKRGQLRIEVNTCLKLIC